MIISIAGYAGAGKSTVAEMLAKKLGYEFYDMGTLRRRTAAARGMTLEEFNAFGEHNPETDHNVDDYQTELGRTKDNFVIQGRTSFHFIPQSFKVFLKVDPEIGAARIWKDLAINPERHNEANVATLEELTESLRARQASDTRRYAQYYNGLDAWDTSQFDLVIDTSSLTPEETVEKIFESISK